MQERILSVVIPVRNQARTVSQLLAALGRLVRPPGWQLEIIAVYTESTDNTLQVLRESGVHVITCDTIGPGAARNAGARMARGELLYFIDADACPIGGDFLVRAIETAERLGNFGVLGGAIELPANQAGNPVAVADHWVCWFNWSAQRPAGESTLFQPSVSIVVPRAVFEAMGGFDTRLRVLEDFELQQRMLARGLRIHYEPTLAVTHEARSSLWRSWRHGWYWGGPFRSAYLAVIPHRGFTFPVGHPCFCLNIPVMFLRRLRLVWRSPPPASRCSSWCCLPFIAIAILIWTLGVVWGPDQPADSQPAPV